MLEAFRRFMAVHRLLPSGARVLVAVSGGLDSMTLAHLFSSLGIDMGVAHVNHGLRGVESDAEERFVLEWCSGNGKPFHTVRVEVAKYAEQSGLSVQMAARELRYDWLRQTAAQYGFTHIATAHHLDDQAETLTAQFIRGKADLSGIPVRNGNVIRPLLFAHRESIREYARAEGIRWCEDSSNAADDYERNRIRHHLIPVLRDFNPAFAEAAGRIGFSALGANEIFAAGLAVVCNELMQPDGSDGFRISIATLLRYDHPASVLYWLLKDFGFPIGTCVDLFSDMNRQPGRQFMGDGFQLTVDREFFLLRPADGDMYRELVIIDGPGEYFLGNLRLLCTAVGQFPEELSSDVAVIDQDQLAFPLAWRKWQPGDVFIPLGMEGHQKVSDFLVNRKISRPDKDRVTVVVSAGEIVWVAGLRIGQQVRVTGQTKTFLRMAISMAEAV